MAPTETTTLRVPVALRDEIAELAAQRGTTLLDVVSVAVHQLRRQQWWDTVHAELDAMSGQEMDDYQSEAVALEPTLADGLRDD